MAEAQFGPYVLRELLGRGGMGEVFRAFDTRRHREVALKLLREDLGPQEQFRTQFQERFRREAFLAARLQDPHIVPIHDFGEIDGRLYLDMRLVEGRDADELLEAEGPMPAPRAVALLEQVAEALDAAHAGGVIHRDVKPSNILITNTDFAYLVDFGIARAAIEATSAGLTATGTAVGTMRYMAPEIFDGATADARVDVYALTCVFHELLTGEAPFHGSTLPALMQAHLHSPPPRPGRTRPGIPPALDDVIVRGLAKNPDERTPTAGELAAAARAALGPTTDDRARTMSLPGPVHPSSPTRISTATPIPPPPGPHPAAPRSAAPYPSSPQQLPLPAQYGAPPPYPVMQPALHAGLSGQQQAPPARSRRALLIAGAIVAALALAVGSGFVADAILDGRNSVAASTTAPSTPSATPTTGTQSTLAPQNWGLTGAQGDLALLVDPAVAGDCRDVNADPQAIGLVAQIECAAVGEGPVSTIVLLRFATLDALNTQINREAQVASNGTAGYDQNCRDGRLNDTWSRQLPDRLVEGRVVCRASSSPRTTLRIAWTFRDQLVTAYAEGDSTTFYRWWTTDAALLR